MALAVGAGRFLLDRESNALFAAARITLLRFQMQNDSLRYAVSTTPGFYLFTAHNGMVNPVTILESFCFDSRTITTIASKPFYDQTYFKRTCRARA